MPSECKVVWLFLNHTNGPSVFGIIALYGQTRPMWELLDMVCGSTPRESINSIYSTYDSLYESVYEVLGLRAFPHGKISIVVLSRVCVRTALIYRWSADSGLGS